MNNRYSEYIKRITDMYDAAVQKAQNNVNALSSNIGILTTAEIHRRRNEILNKLNETTVEYNNAFDDALQQFMSAYSIRFPNDGKDHSTDISNALSIINTLGYSLDTKNLNNIIAPMSKSFDSVKTVCDLILTKQSSAVSVKYDPEVIQAVNKLLGTELRVPDYIDRIKMLNDIVESDKKYNYYIEGSSGIKVRLTAAPSYNVLSTPTWLDETVQMYNEIMESNLFKK